MTVDIATLGIEVKSDGVLTASKHLHDLEAQSGRTETKVKTFAKSAADGLTSVAKYAAAAVVSFTALGVAAAGMTIKTALSEFTEFETKIIDLGKVGVTNFEEIKGKILALDPALGSVTQMASGYYEVMSAGITDSIQSMDALVVSSQLAKAAHMDQATAVQAVTGGMKAFNVSAEEVADALLQIEATGASGTTVATLAPLYGEIAGNAHALGIEMNATNAAFAAMTQLSGTVEKGSTKILQVFRTLLNPSKELDAVFAQFGGTMNAIKEIGFEGVLERIHTASGGTAEGLQALNIEGEATSAFALLLNNNMAALNTALDAQANKAGSLASAWQQYGGTLSAIWDTAKNQIGEQIILLGEKLAPKVKEVIGDFSKWLEVNQEMIQAGFTEWVDEFVNSIGKIDFDKLASGAAKLAEGLTKIVQAGVWLVEHNPFKGWSEIITILGGNFDDLAKKQAGFTEAQIENDKTIAAMTENIQNMRDKLESPFWNAILTTEQLANIKRQADEAQAYLETVKINPKLDAAAMQIELDKATKMAKDTPAEIVVTAQVEDVRIQLDSIKPILDDLVTPKNISVALDAAQVFTQLNMVTGELEKVLKPPPIEITADTSKAKAEAIMFKDEVSRGGVMFPVDANTEPAKAEMERLEFEVNGKKFYIDVIANTAEASTAANTLLDEVKSMQASIRIGGDTDDAIKRLAEIKAMIEKEKALVSIGADPTMATKELSELEKLVNTTEAAIQVLADATPAEQTVQETADAIEAMPVTLQVDADTSKAEQKINALGQKIQKGWESKQDIDEYNEEKGHTTLSKKQYQILTKYGASYEVGTFGTGYWINIQSAIEKAKAAGEWDSFAVGTGNPGLRYSGIFEGHAGEIMLSPEASDRVRSAGSVGAVSAELFGRSSGSLFSGQTKSDSAAMGSVMAELTRTGMYAGEKGQIIYTKSDSDQIRQSMRSPMQELVPTMAYASGTGAPLSVTPMSFSAPGNRREEKTYIQINSGMVGDRQFQSNQDMARAVVKELNHSKARFGDM